MDHRLRARVIFYHLPIAVQLWLMKNADYGSGHNEFGPKAQIIDIARKYKKLKSAVWDEQPLDNEGVTEVAMDMIGHLLLLIDQVTEHPQQVFEPEPIDAERWRLVYGDAMAKMADVDGVAEFRSPAHG